MQEDRGLHCCRWPPSGRAIQTDGNESHVKESPHSNRNLTEVFLPRHRSCARRLSRGKTRWTRSSWGRPACYRAARGADRLPTCSCARTVTPVRRGGRSGDIEDSLGEAFFEGAGRPGRECGGRRWTAGVGVAGRDGGGDGAVTVGPACHPGACLWRLTPGGSSAPVTVLHGEVDSSGMGVLHEPRTTVITIVVTTFLLPVITTFLLPALTPARFTPRPDLVMSVHRPTDRRSSVPDHLAFGTEDGRPRRRSAVPVVRALPNSVSTG